MAAARATFRKHERLTGRDAINAVVRSGMVTHDPPFRLVGLFTTSDALTPARVAFAVPKRFLRHATDRNRARRLMREAYRLDKDRWYAPLRAAGKQCAWLVVYQSSQLLGYAETRTRLSRALDRWMEQHLRP